MGMAVNSVIRASLLHPTAHTVWSDSLYVSAPAVWSRARCMTQRSKWHQVINTRSIQQKSIRSAPSELGDTWILKCDLACMNTVTQGFWYFLLLHSLTHGFDCANRVFTTAVGRSRQGLHNAVLDIEIWPDSPEVTEIHWLKVTVSTSWVCTED